MEEISKIISYDKIIEMATAINDIEVIDKTRLGIIYNLPKEAHFKLDEDLYYRGDKKSPFEHTEVIEVEIDGIQFKFVSEEE